MLPVNTSATPASIETPTAAHGLESTPDRVRRRFHGQFVAGLAIVLTVAVVSILAPWIAPHDPIAADATQRYLEPFSAGHLLGTDEQGRDIASRLLWGGRSTLLPTFAATTVAVFLGSIIGLLAAFRNSWASAWVMRLVDLMFAFPVIIVALSAAEIVGMGVVVVMVAVVFAATPYVARIVYGQARLQREQDYVRSARALGARPLDVLVREILPNVSTSILVYWTGLVGIMTVFASSLSSLGIGVQPPTADWGRMVSEGAKVLLSGSPWVALIPGLAILAVGLAFNWIGDGLRDIFDPRSERRS